jgi:hypothetical protein
MHKEIIIALLIFLIIIVFIIYLIKRNEDPIPINYTRPLRYVANRIDNIEPIFNDPYLDWLLTNDPPEKTNKKTYYDDIQTHDNDSQNVHNSMVIKLLAKKFQRLLELSKLIDNKDIEGSGMEKTEIENAKIDESIYQIKKFSEEYLTQLNKDNKIDIQEMNIRISKIN